MLAPYFAPLLESLKNFWNIPPSLDEWNPGGFVFWGGGGGQGRSALAQQLAKTPVT